MADVFLVLAAIPLLLAVVLLIHHKRKHSAYGEHYISDPCLQWFQPEDVCNARCAHEKWVVALVITGVVFFVVGLVRENS